MPRYILSLQDIDKSSLELAGGKGANLGELAKAGFPIPQGFVVTVSAYKEFIEKNNLHKKIASLLTNLDVENTVQLQKVSTTIQELILSTPLWQELKQEIEKEYQKLGGFVAVRSSATAEDLPTASFAGQQATFLNVKDKVAEKVKECWASLFTARAIYYRAQNKFDHRSVFIAVVVQRMVNSTTAGVMFTLNPATNDTSQIVIEAVSGLGELLVGGQVTPDMYIVSKEGNILEKHVQDQTKGLFRDEEGNNEEREINNNKQKISNEQILTLAKIGKQIEQHYNFPQDIEFALENDSLFITQSRPVTTYNPTE